MTMEPIQNVTAAYQGSGSAVEAGAKTAAVRDVISQPQDIHSKPADKEKNEKNDKNDKSGAKFKDMITQPEVASDSSLKKAVEDINKKSGNMEAVFGYHEGTHRVTIKIMDKDTKEVKREYPAEKTLDMIQKVWEMAGLMVDEKR